MADLIDRGALYKEVEEWEAAAMEAVKKATNVEERKKWGVILQERTAFKLDVADAPAVDAVPVVRCKDCSLWSNGKCDVWSNLGVTILTAETGYCNFGERRDDGEIH